jgi:hypothetical protein
MAAASMFMTLLTASRGEQFAEMDELLDELTVDEMRSVLVAGIGVLNALLTTLESRGLDADSTVRRLAVAYAKECSK